MLVETHMLQNFAPSNLNRDDTGAPKDCEFGGYRRARISSQCLKRSMRNIFREQDLLPKEHLAHRTKRVVEECGKRLASKGKPEAEARAVVQTILGGAQLKVVEDSKTQYLLYLGETEIQRLADLCERHWDALRPLAMATATGGDGSAANQVRQSAKDAKRAAKAAVPKEITAELVKLLDGGKAADVALFGRMVADLPDRNLDAASQVAHALSTHRVSTEFDFYTAVDDLRPADTAGSDMLGTIEFNSACYYRYANVDLRELERNLGGDTELAHRTLEAFLRAAVMAVPTGKQNSMAAQNPPSLVFVVLRDAGLWSLANAFVAPVRPSQDGDLVRQSITALDAYWGKLVKMYGDEGIRGTWVASLEDAALPNLGKGPVVSVPELIASVVAAVSSGATAGATA